MGDETLNQIAVSLARVETDVGWIKSQMEVGNVTFVEHDARITSLENDRAKVGGGWKVLAGIVAGVVVLAGLVLAVIELVIKG